MKILVIPDVHGRDFWKSPVKRYLKKVDKVVFLGDYFDPYEDEGVEYTFKHTMDNFNEILQLKRGNPDKVVLLLGNHDFHYKNSLFEEIARSTRFNPFYCKTIGIALNDNSDLFQLCYCVDNYDKKLIFSHAGVTSYWLEQAEIKLDENLEKNINDLQFTNEGVHKLAIIGRERSWFGNKTGSPLWCDLKEFMSDKVLGENYYQIFGHTRLKKGASVHTGDFSCIDSQYAFRINDKNKIKRIEDETVKTNEKQRAVQDSQDDKSQ